MDDTAAAAQDCGGLVKARRLIVAARARDARPSDGGSTGKSDGND